MLSFLSSLNTTVNHLVWGPVMLLVFLAIGLLFTIRSRLFQLRYLKHWLHVTIGQIFKQRTKSGNGQHGITPFQALCTALAATVGTGNIAGVATAITIGGPGAIFWLWVSAFLGMMTSFAEKSLGIKYRYKDKQGEWVGGAMVYMEKGLGAKWLGMLFCIACALASFGIGNMVQVNTIADSLESSFQIKPYITGSVLTILVSLVILGGIQRIASITEKLVPFMAAFYIIGGLIVIAVNYQAIPSVFYSIVTEAFRFRCVGGGILGYSAMTAMRIGISRGIFSNEAGLGSSVMAHSASDVTEPAIQGMWGICEVFIDTIVLCTVTAFVILTSGVYDMEAWLMNPSNGTKMLTGAPLTSAAFSSVIPYGDKFLTIAIILFALATVIGWSYFGERAILYLFGPKAVFPYKVIYILVVYLGCVASLDLVWSISDTFNGLMAIPNLTALALLSGEAISILKNYIKKLP